MGGVFVDGGNDSYVRSSVISTGPMSFAMTLQLTAAELASLNQGYLVNLQQNISPAALSWIIQTTTSSQIQALQFMSGTDLSVASTNVMTGGGAMITADTPFTLIVTDDATFSGTGTKIYIDNVEVSYAVQQAGTGTPNNRLGPTFLFDNGASTTRTYGGRANRFGMWGAVITDVERASYQAGDNPAIVRRADLISDLTMIDVSPVDAVLSDWTVNGSPATWLGPNEAQSLLSADLTGGTPTLDTPTLAEVTAGVDALTAADLVSSAPVLDTPTLTELGITISEGFECNSVNPAACTIGGTLSAPTVTLVTYKALNGVLWRSCFGRISGMTGKTLELTLDSAGMSYAFIAAQEFWWRPVGGGYHEGVGGWQKFESTIVTSGVMVAGQTTPFTDDAIEFCEQPFITPSQKATAWAARIAASAHVTATDAAHPTTGRFNELVATTGHNGMVIPALWQHSITIGSGPRIAVHIGQQHPHEGTGAIALEAAMDRWIDGSPAMEAHLAQWTHVVVEANPQGVYGLDQNAATWQAGQVGTNCNREWDSAVLNCVNACKTLISGTVGHANIRAVIDWHNRLSGTSGQESAIFLNPAWGFANEFHTAFNAAYPNTDFTKVTITTDAGVCQNYYHNLLTPEVLAATMEQAQATDPFYSAITDCGVAAADAIDAMTLAGEFGHDLVASDLIGAAPVLDTPTLGQVHVLTSADLVGGVPTLETSNFNSPAFIPETPMGGQSYGLLRSVGGLMNP